MSWFRRREEPRRKYTFEYRVIEKKSANGKSYFIGESTECGERTMLTENPYTVQQRERQLYSLSGYRDPLDAARRERPRVYQLMNIEAAAKTESYGGSAYRFSEFSDPCAVKEAICKIRADAKTRRLNLSYRKVVSEGKCNECS